ncbi:MAG: DUF1579 family protein [Candidatus Eremiobacterota bacterium]
MRWILFLCLLTSPLAAQDRLPAENRAVLDRFVGQWTTEVRIRFLGQSPREFAGRGQAHAEWTLEGRFVEFRGSTLPPGESDLQVMTCDVETGRYRQWLFDSSGYVHEAWGTWDASSSTLTWRGSDFVIQDRFVTPDRLEWSLVRTAPDGSVLQRIEGVVTRR